MNDTMIALSGIAVAITATLAIPRGVRRENENLNEQDTGPAIFPEPTHAAGQMGGLRCESSVNGGAGVRHRCPPKPVSASGDGANHPPVGNKIKAGKRGESSAPGADTDKNNSSFHGNDQ